MSINQDVIRRSSPLWDMLGSRMPKGVLGLSDPDVHRIDDEWVMFIGGFSTTFRNRLYVATTGALDPYTAQWKLNARPVVTDPPRDGWDAGGMHTPSYVPAHAGHEPLLFYAGRRGRLHYGPQSAYAIGMLRQQPDGRWQRHSEPVLTGWSDRRSVLEPLVIPVDGGYRMWFLATPNEVAPGEQPDFELCVSDSTDGVTWQQPLLFASRAEGFFDNAVYRTGSGWEMIVARGTNLHGTTPFPEQGLWVMHANHPSADRADWSTPERLMDTDAPHTPSWLARGVCGPSVAVRNDDSRILFFTGTHDSKSWAHAARTRLRAAGRLPVPAPFFLATGRTVLPPAIP